MSAYNYCAFIVINFIREYRILPINSRSLCSSHPWVVAGSLHIKTL